MGPGFRRDSFPLMVKLIDAAARLSVQVHPDDALARSLSVGANGKTECWLVLEDGGELYQGTTPGVDRPAFERALQEGRVAETLNHYRPRAGDFFFMKARTVHALGAGCLVYELQQTLDITFRVWDWGRVGTDGKPRTMHVKEALETIDFGASGFGPQRPAWQDQGWQRTLVDGDHFGLQEFNVSEDGDFSGAVNATCAVVTCLSGEGTLSTRGGAVNLVPGRTAVIPAAAGLFSVDRRVPMHLLVATPKI